MIGKAGSILALVLAVAAAPVTAQEKPAATASAVLDAEKPGPVISRYIFSQFAEHIGSGIYGGLWVGADSPIPNTRGMRNDVLAALRRLHVPLVRWPGGCFADIYHWRDGIGPQAKRPARVNSHWGGIIDSNHFGTHEFMDFVEAIGSEAYVNGNVGTSTPQETVEWIEYMTAPAGTLAEERARNGRKAPWKIAYWGVGNELWGCGGRMPADYAAALTRQYSQFIKTPGGPVSIQNFQRPVLVASGADAEDYDWTEVMMRVAGERFDALALHYYTIPDRKGAFGSGTDFDEASYARTLSRTLFMEELVSKHAAIMDKHDPGKRVNLAVDEWGVLTNIVPGHGPRSLFMQNSLRDALLAALNFNIFIHHADRVRMTSIAQMINVAQSMILTRDAEMVLTPTYHAFEMYVPFQDAVSLPLDIRTPDYAKGEWRMAAVSGVAARGKDGVVHVALTNVDPNRSVRTTVTLDGVRAREVSGRILTAEGITSHNDFGTPEVVKPRPFAGAQVKGGTLAVDLPPHSLVVLGTRPVKRIAAALFAGAALAATAPVPQPRPNAGRLAPVPQRPNILFILIDDMGFGDLSVTGNRGVSTPNIDRLAAEGLLMTQFYDAAPICSPSRVGFFTGQYPARNRFVTYVGSRAQNAKLGQADWLDPNLLTLADMLHDAGYATAHFGKWHMGGGRDVGDAPLITEYGFDESYTQFEGLGPRVLPSNVEDEMQRLGEQSAAHGRGHVDYLRRGEITARYVDKTLDFVARNKDRPWFVQLWPDDVHAPWIPDDDQRAVVAGKGRDRNEAEFFAVLVEMDRQIGRLVEALRSAGELDDTLIVLTSDNGPNSVARFYKDGGTPPGSAGIYRGRKDSLYEGGIRQPMIVRWPGHVPAGKRDDRTIAHGVDLLPTLASATGIRIEGKRDGVSLWKAWRGKPIDRRSDLFWTYGAYGPRAASPRPTLPIDNSPGFGIRSGRWKLLAEGDGSHAELYDIERDPRERRNLAAERPAVARALRARLVAWQNTLPLRPSFAPRAAEGDAPVAE